MNIKHLKQQVNRISRSSRRHFLIAVGTLLIASCANPANNAASSPAACSFLGALSWGAGQWHGVCGLELAFVTIAAVLHFGRGR